MQKTEKDIHIHDRALPVLCFMNIPTVSKQMPKRKHSHYSCIQNLRNFRSKKVQHDEGMETGVHFPSLLTIT
jgi:hypothetical protein